MLSETQHRQLEPDVISFSAAISACKKGEKWQQALGVLSALFGLQQCSVPERGSGKFSELYHLEEGNVVTRFPWVNLRKDHSHASTLLDLKLLSEVLGGAVKLSCGISRAANRGSVVLLL